MALPVVSYQAYADCSASYLPLFKLLKAIAAAFNFINSPIGDNVVLEHYMLYLFLFRRRRTLPNINSISKHS